MVTDADTAYGNAALFPDDRIGALALVSGGEAGFDEEWIWTGVAWVQLEPQAT